MPLDENWLSSKCCKFDKSNSFGIKLLHAHLQYVCHIPAIYQINRVGGGGGGVRVDVNEELKFL